MSDKVDLRLDWCSYEAAKYAVEHWHYSKVLPAGKLVKIGVWEDGQYIGCVIFGRGANNNIGKPYGLSQLNVCELVRIALKEHKTPVSKIGAISIKMLKKQSSDIRLIISYADPAQDHKGAIYQAMNWVYLGMSDNWRGSHYLVYLHGDGRPPVPMHGRSARSKFGNEKSIPYKFDIAPPANKHKYLFPLDDAMRKQIEPLRKPYPKRGEGETDNAAQSNEQIEGARPISPLLVSNDKAVTNA